MFANIRRLLNRFFNKSSTINNEPLNKVSLIVIVLIDLFILINVFTGLDDISRWYLSPSQVYPCYAQWDHYLTQTTKNKDYEIIQLSLRDRTDGQSSFQQRDRQAENGHLGKVSASCLTYAGAKDALKTPQNQQILRAIEQKQTAIDALNQTNNTIRAQYDSTLLEKIAAQPREQSLNAVGAEKAKQTLDQNNRKLSTLTKERSALQTELTQKPESIAFIAFLNQSETFKAVKAGDEKASFWYPSIQLAFQSLFLLPLILLALSVHRFAQRKGYGLAALMSWHLLVIFLVPLVLKVFEFLQVGALFQFAFDLFSVLFSGLLFLISYVYILLIPLIGFGIIKFFQKMVFNAKVQAASRVQKSRCVRCAKNIRHHDAYCPHCGYYQRVECHHCHELTYQHLPYCKQCGYAQEPEPLQ